MNLQAIDGIRFHDHMSDELKGSFPTTLIENQLVRQYGRSAHGIDAFILKDGKAAFLEFKYTARASQDVCDKLITRSTFVQSKLRLPNLEVRLFYVLKHMPRDALRRKYQDKITFVSQRDDNVRLSDETLKSLRDFFGASPDVPVDAQVIVEDIESVDDLDILTLKDFISSGRLQPWSRQRPMVTSRLPDIKDYVITCHAEPDFVMPPVLIAKIQGANKLQVLDGQHRLWGLNMIIAADMTDSLRNWKIPVDYRKVTEEQANRMYDVINRSQPSRALFMSMEQRHEEIIALRRELKVDIFPDFSWDKSKSPQVPKINFDEVMDMISTRFDGWCHTGKFTDMRSIKVRILALNEEMKHKFDDDALAYERYKDYFALSKASGSTMSEDTFFKRLEEIETVASCYLGLLRSGVWVNLL